MKILVLNAGSSSLKCSLFNLDKNNPAIAGEPIWQKQTNRSGTDAPGLHILLRSLWESDRPIISSPSEIDAIGHRIVHGGTKYCDSTLITEEVIDDLNKLIELAPSHEPAGIEGIKICQGLFKNVPQIAVFDTAFHSSLDETAIVYPGPYEWYKDLGIRRFGFHGTSHQYCANRAAAMLNKDLHSLRIITCHLGNGASLSAIKNGKSVMNTMGYTPLEGLMMGTRSGSIDPGIILHLLQNKLSTTDELTDILNKQSGLKGISGITADMREIVELTESGNKRAQLAFDMYIESLTSHIASLLPRLGGLDMLVFTGGIGQNSSAVRKATCKQLAFLGITIDAAKNDLCKSDMDISGTEAKISTLVIQTQEEASIAKECLGFLS